MKAKFRVIGFAEGGDEADIKKWIEDSINDYNVMPKVVDKFTVDVWEVDKY